MRIDVTIVTSVPLGVDTPGRPRNRPPHTGKYRNGCYKAHMTKKLKIAFQGEPGANSHIAIAEAYPDAEPLPCATFEDALAAISSGEADLGMIPIENSVAGRVADIHHLLPASGLFIVGEWFLPVRHQLMAVRGTKLTDIKTVESHVHALGQCRRIIRKLGIKPIVAADTAGSARDISERGDKTIAAIASRLAAKIYGLDILAEDVEDEAHNTTRFVVLAREANWAKQGSGPLVTTFVFRVRNLPAALYKALGGFATNGVNMTKLESYMVDGEFSATQFYADVDGHPGRSRACLCAGGVEILLARIPHRRRLSRASVPGDVQWDAGVAASGRSQSAVMARACPGHPRLPFRGKDVDARHKAGHDEARVRTLRKSFYAAAFLPKPNASASRLYDFFRASWS